MTAAILEILKLGLVGLVAGLFSSVLANRDYRQRKWWELRVSAYQNAIEALSDLVYYYEKHYNSEVYNRKLSDEFKKELNVYWEQAFPKIRKYADSGAFLFSDEVNDALREFINDDDEPTYIDHLDNNLAKARKCLNRLVESSKKDLKLKPSFMERWF